MTLVRRLLGFWVIGRTVSSGTSLLTRLLLGMAAIAILIAFAVLFTAFIVVALLWMTYEQLLLSGMDKMAAVVVLSGIVLALLAATVLMAKQHLSNIHHLTNLALQPNTPPALRRFSPVINAFMDGLLTERRPRY